MSLFLAVEEVEAAALAAGFFECETVGAGFVAEEKGRLAAPSLGV
jgi:hypothetical protein